jgi:broad specificity phosphatase PhoE
MTTLLLIRHGMTDAVGRRLTGRLPGVQLNEQGKREVEALAKRLQSVPLSAVYSSPMERTLQTAQAIALPHQLEVIERAALIESDFGDWSGRLLVDLDRDEGWQRFNGNRSGSPPPGGEHMTTVQGRMAEELVRIRDAHDDQTVAVVSHGDPLRAVLCLFLGISIDLMQRIEVTTASVSVLRLTRDSVTLLRLNDTGS